jgi:hypothetical protein
MPCSRVRDLQNHSPGEVLCDTVVATLIRMHAPVYAGLVHRFGHLSNLIQEMREYVWIRALLETLRNPTQVSDIPSLPHVHRVFWTTSKDQVASRSADSTGSHPDSVTIGLRTAWTTQALASTSSFGSPTPASTRFTWPP